MKNIRKWLIPSILFAIGVILYGFVVGHSFLGLVCMGIAAVICCYRLLNILQIKKEKTAKVLRRVLTGILVLGVLIYAVTLVPIFRAAAGDADTDCQYIVVLGAKVNGTDPSLTLRERINAAYDYLAAHPDTIAVLSGGQGSDEGISEARCMFNELTELGIDPQRLWMEDRSTSTWENLNFTLALIEEKTGIRPDAIGLVSSEFHLFRAGLFAKDCGVTAVGIPARTGWLSLRINHYLREVAGVWHYIILGG